MKHCLFLLLGLIVLGCITPSNPTVPAGYKHCSTDWDCSRGSYCGFVGVDTYPVCKH